MAGLTQAAMYHRQAAALADAADRVGVAESELPAIRLRLLQQRALFADVLIGTDTPIPDLLPTPADIAAAMPGLGDLSRPAVATALARIVANLDAADAALGVPPKPTPVAKPVGEPAEALVPQPPPAASPPATAGPPRAGPVPGGPVVPASGWPAAAPPPRPGVYGWRPGRRNALVYGGYAVTVTVLQAVLFTLVDERTLPLLAPCCLFVMPAFAWAAGWFTVGIAFRGGPVGEKVDRTPRVGALICLIPDLLLCAGVGVLSFVDR